jgi:hypothetical protein
MNSEKKILLMFLGGTPNTDNIIKHWKTITEQFTTKNNYYIVVHPIILDTYTINSDFKQIFKQDNIYTVSTNFHLLTEWGTRSLTDATLLMMEYAHLQNNRNLFDKYILLSSECSPLYNLDEIYNVITKNNKSWLSTNNNIELIHDSEKNNLSFDECFIPNIHYKFSQWMILDKIHVQFFFPHEMTQIYEKKYKKVCNKPINLIEIIDTSCKICNELRYYLQRYSPCKISDEEFFGNYIFYKLLCPKQRDTILTSDERLNILRDNIETISDEGFKHNLQYIPKSILKRLNVINTNNLLTFTLLEPLIKLDPTEILYDIGSNYLISSHKNYKSKISSINIDEQMDDIKITILDDKLFLKKSTYTNWELVSIHPFNIIRGIPFNINPNEFIMNINELLNSEYFLVNIINKMDSIITFTNPKNFMGPSSHPNEYSTWTFLSILNAYLLLRYCINKNYIKYFTNDILKAYLIYHKIICKELSIVSDLPELISDSYEYLLNIITTINSLYDIELFKIIEDKVIEYKNILNKKYGSPITANIIISALGFGSLFIRKCYDSSLIETYSDVLKTCVYNNPQPDVIQEIQESSIEIKPLFDLNIYIKYLKYKSKYTKLRLASNKN